MMIKYLTNVTISLSLFFSLHLQSFLFSQVFLLPTAIPHLGFAIFSLSAIHISSNFIQNQELETKRCFFIKNSFSFPQFLIWVFKRRRRRTKKVIPLSEVPASCCYSSSGSSLDLCLLMEREEILNFTLSDNFNTNFVSFNWDQSVEQTSQFESAMSSMVSSPSNQTPPSDNVVIRELIGRLGSICNSAGELSPPSHLYNNNSTVASCYSTPLNSPPKLGLLMQEYHHQVWANLPVSGSPLPAPTATHLGGFTADPQFAKRAARFSSIDSNRYGGNGFFPRPECAGKLSRVSSSKSLKSSGCGESQVDEGENGNGREEPSGSDHGVTAIAGGSARKRKATLRGKAKVSVTDDENGKKNRSNESKLDHENEKENNSKPPEPPKQDFIHVRARRGQATDSHSLAERVRREKISERMKFLQGLVPGCDKITGKAVMLDEIINYVQSLQRQVEFLSMKLATINPPLDLNTDNFIQKDMIGTLQHSVFPVEASGLPFPFVQSPFQCQTGITNDLQVHCGSNPLDAKLRRAINANLPSLDGFSDAASMFSDWGDDYQSVAQMRSDQSQEDAFSSQHFTGPSPSANMKIEL